ncbi:hypothetical protein SAMN05216274_102110 [Cryobacterium levicorallinum]|uniref:Uncharacterized protein n=1 Tax=Cryobacterium levicorallinum TaxID=995038 RepID=A0ABY1EA32_9MICO|nr:hypothetical protein SAMN05216274_102110 [Cryobacterium levicorallinum]
MAGIPFQAERRAVAFRLAFAPRYPGSSAYPSTSSVCLAFTAENIAKTNASADMKFGSSNDVETA